MTESAELRSSVAYDQREMTVDPRTGKRRRSLIPALLARVGVPASFLEVSGGVGPQWERVVEELTAWTINSAEHPGVRITGAPRTGKTTLAVAGLHWAVQRNCTVGFAKASEIADMARAIARDGDDEREQWEVLTRAIDVFVIDDLALLGITTEFTNNAVLDFVRTRAANALFTIVSQAFGFKRGKTNESPVAGKEAAQSLTDWLAAALPKVELG